MKIQCICLIALLLVYAPWAAAAPKTDIVILTNGDRVTGEIKRLEAGLLELDTDYMGTLKIEWLHISRIFSQQNLAVETTDGRRVTGRLQKETTGDELIVTTAGGVVDLAPEDIVEVWPVAATFLDKSTLDLSVGIDYAKSTEIGNYNLAVDFNHTSIDRYTDASLRSSITRQSDGAEQSRQEVRFSHNYMRPEKRFRTWLGGVESNDALDLNLRASGGYAFGKFLVKSNVSWFYLIAGLVATEERYTGEGDTVSLEALGQARYRYFRYDSPKRSVDTTLTVLPSLTESGRIRSNLRTTFKLELVKDLFWSLEFYASHDTNPPREGVEKTDYGITSALGYSF